METTAATHVRSLQALQSGDTVAVTMRNCNVIYVTRTVHSEAPAEGWITGLSLHSHHALPTQLRVSPVQIALRDDLAPGKHLHARRGRIGVVVDLGEIETVQWG